MAKSYEIIADQYTIHRQVGELTDPITGRVIGVQQGAGKVWFKGEVVPASEVSPLLIEALEDEDHPSHAYVAARIKESGADAKLALAQRLGIPFAGYEDMDEEDILAAMRVLPSATVQAVKEYELAQSDPRERIVNYSIGFGVSPTDHEEGRVSSDLDEDSRDEADKAAAALTTREVPEEGIVQRGEGITGTGDPEVAHGSQKEGDEGDQQGNQAARRRSRRQRQTGNQGKQAGEKSGEGEGGSE